MVKTNRFVKMDVSECDTPTAVIPEAKNRIIIYGDYKVTVYPNIIVDRYPLPTLEELVNWSCSSLRILQ